MQYLRQVWQLKDKFRVIAIAALALAVLGLSVVDSVSDANEFREHGGEMHMHMH